MAHGHSHGGGQRADYWTVIGAIGEGAATLVSNTYWLGSIIDLAAQLDEADIGLSYYGFGFGAALSLLLTFGSVYAHSVVNMNHQDGDTEDHQCADIESTDEQKSPILSDTTKSSDITDNSAIDLGRQDDQKHAAKVKLSCFQRSSLLFDFISHSGEISGPLVMAAEIATKGSMSVLQKGLVTAACTVFGAKSSWAGVRVCKKNMLTRNEQNTTDAASNCRRYGGV